MNRQNMAVVYNFNSIGEILENARERNRQTTFAMQMAATVAPCISVAGNVQLCTLFLELRLNEGLGGNRVMWRCVGELRKVKYAVQSEEKRWACRAVHQIGV